MNAKTKAGNKSVIDLFRQRVDADGSNTAYRYPTASGWQSQTWSEVAAKVRKLALGLRALGLGTADRAAIASSTRIEWIWADLAILAAGGATTTVYPTSTVEDMVYILNDSRSRVVFAEDQSQVDRLIEARSQVPEVVQVVAFDGKKRSDDWVITLDELVAKGEAHDKANPDLYDAIAKEVEPSAVATLIYTSGTTGRPKGVELLHDGWVAMGESIRDTGLLKPDAHQFLWLPLSHSFGKALIVIQLAVGFPTSVDGDLKKIIDNLAVVKPTFMASAPRIFEKVYNKISMGAEQAGGLKLKIFRWAVKVGREVTQIRQKGGSPGALLNLQYALADKLVYSKLRARFGGNLEFFVSGSAPLSRELAEFFEGAGLPILEGYGLTESSAASFVNRPGQNRIGTVGPPIDAIELKIADDGEILLRGRPIMRGYHNLPDVTSETLDEQGWLHTGDIGELDEAGHLRITDRKKDLIKTSGGKYVAPQKIEGQLKVLCPYIGQVVVHGDRRNYCVALVTLDSESVGEWAEQVGLSGKPYEELAKSEQARTMIQEAVDKLNQDLARYETIKKFEILPKDLSIEDGTLTPSLKVKRKAVEKRYESTLDGMYKGSVADL